LDRWIDSACYASAYEEDIDFIIVPETRIKQDEPKEFSVAIILVNKFPNFYVKWSDGVYQLLHARLEKQREQENPDAPPFPCDAEIPYVASETNKNLIDYYLKMGGRVFGLSGTTGNEQEIKEQAEKFDMTCVRIPPRLKNRREYLQSQFGFNSRFAFSRRTQHDLLKVEIKRSARKGNRQPMVLFCEDIPESEEIYQYLQAFCPDIGYQCQIVNGKQQDHGVEWFIDKAGEQGQITICTGMLGCGADIIARHQDVIKVGLLYPESYRNQKQIEGRTARNGTDGQFFAIYDLDAIAKKYGLRMSKISRRHNLKQIDLLQKRLDHLAYVERYFEERVGDIKHQLFMLFDQWIKFFWCDNALRDKYLEAMDLKSEFIKTLEKRWKTLSTEYHVKHPELSPENDFGLIEAFEQQAKQEFKDNVTKLLKLSGNYDPLKSVRKEQIQPKEEKPAEQAFFESRKDVHGALLKYVGPGINQNEKFFLALGSFASQFKERLTLIKSEIKQCPLPKAFVNGVNDIIDTMPDPSDVTSVALDYYFSELTKLYVDNVAKCKDAKFKVNQFTELFLEPLVKIVGRIPSQDDTIRKTVEKHVSQTRKELFKAQLIDYRDNSLFKRHRSKDRIEDVNDLLRDLEGKEITTLLIDEYKDRSVAHDTEVNKQRLSFFARPTKSRFRSLLNDVSFSVGPAVR